MLLGSDEKRHWCLLCFRASCLRRICSLCMASVTFYASFSFNMRIYINLLLCYLSTNHPSPCHAPKWREIGFVPAPAIFVFGFNQVLSLQQDNHVHHVSGFRYGLHEIEGDSASANPRTNRSIDLGFARGVSSDEQP
jgi:hypothetical protein